jgi:hypothetical protein
LASLLYSTNTPDFYDYTTNVRYFPSIKKKVFFVTIVTCMIPTGHLIPPLLLFPEKNMKLEMMNGTPLASLYICHPSEWI